MCVMRNLVYCLIIFFSGLGMMSAKAENHDKLYFNIKAEIEGLSKGDTICFDLIHLPWWTLEPVFKVVVEEDGGFTYNGFAYYSQYFLMTYKPVSRKEQYTDKRGLFIFVDGAGDISIKGNVANIYYSQIHGGVYDNTYVQEISMLESKLETERASLIKSTEEARLSRDAANFRENSNKLESFDADSKADYEKLSKLKAEFMEKDPSSALNIVEMLQQVTYTPLEELESYYAKLNEDARKSYYGIFLRQEIDNIAMLAPGNDAPDFFLNTMDGRQISLDDYSGYYVIIYHYGLCPGSLMIDKEVILLNNKNKDKVRVIGFTEDVNSLRLLFDVVSPTEKLMGIDVKSALEGMISHPWTDIERKDDNIQLSIDYAIVGYPFFVIISPDRKILARGFQEAFYKAKEIIEGETISD